MILASQPNKPHRLNNKEYPNKDSNKKYHLDYARWAIESAQNQSYNAWLAKIRVNKSFYKGDQWVYDEDKEAFLKDTTGAVKNRIKIVHNVIRPMVEQFRGNASILKINATAKSISKMSVNRRDLALSERIFKTKAANEFPGLGAIMRKNDQSIGQDEQETTQIFENLYVDMFVSQMNSLMKYVENLNQFDRFKVKLAQNLALTGVIVVEGFEHGGHQRFRIIESEDYFWDPDSREYDHSDAAYKGYVEPMDVSMVLEMYQPSQDDAYMLETYVSVISNSEEIENDGGRTFTGSRVPVYKVFWRDTIKIEYGYVEDEFGYPYLTKINYIEPGEDEPRYTDEDLIDPPKSVRNRKLFKNGAKKRNLFLDCERFCTFIPGEYLASAFKDNKQMERDTYDVILDFGLTDYQETDYLDISNVKCSIKTQTWGYVDGEIFSPVDDAINPQRFINRVLSVAEQLINNSGGSGMIVDEDAIDPNSGPAEFYADSKEGKTLTVRTKGKGVPNTVGYYDNTPKQGVYGMFNIIPTIKQMIQDTTGVNEALKGESTGSDQLVGVTQLLIQRGSLMQEPFYNAMTDLFVQMYQHIATVGKRMYIDNERELSIITGDEGVEILQLSADLKNEDFRVFITRENDDAVLKAQANQMLTIFLQSGLIDDKVFANLYNRATPDDVTMALRSQAGLRIEAARRAEREQRAAEASANEQATFLQERDRQDKLNAQNQQERIADKQIAAKNNDMITKALIDEDTRNRLGQQQ